MDVLRDCAGERKSRRQREKEREVRSYAVHSLDQATKRFDLVMMSLDLAMECIFDNEAEARRWWWLWLWTECDSKFSGRYGGVWR